MCDNFRDNNIQGENVLYIDFSISAINECGLVYDGGLVVSASFVTNDPCIYGAGTCVRYSRKLYATQRLHGYYCSEEVGEAVRYL